MKFSYQEWLNQLPKPPNEKWREGVWDIEAFKHGTMSLEVFAPHNRDYQTPHMQDELYFVVQGRGEFVLENERIPFEVGDALFVPAGKSHHFENFSDDFVTWVVFWGPQGGESAE
jgi:mannose-6-phosphate isomerase-like protein (cupin superfamily)